MLPIWLVTMTTVARMPALTPNRRTLLFVRRDPK
jgi:hypothetical protein